MKFKVLFNPLSGNVNDTDIKTELTTLMPDDELDFTDITAIDNLVSFLEGVTSDTAILLVGGDGTINRFVNDSDGMYHEFSIFYYAAGNGNDFWNDLGFKRGDKPVCIDKYLEYLPTVTVNGKTYKFINGIGYGIDGYCCEVGDKLKAEGKKVNYTSIAIKGLLGGYKPCDAEVKVYANESDEPAEYYFKKAWIAPSMLGRYYGGGMIPTPNQDRLNSDGTLSLCVMYGKGKLTTLIVFPSIFKGEHVKKTEMVKVLTGRKITVKFPRPSALQIDGETVLNVSEYTVEFNR